MVEIGSDFLSTH